MFQSTCSNAVPVAAAGAFEDGALAVDAKKVCDLVKWSKRWEGGINDDNPAFLAEVPNSISDPNTPPPNS